jgi:hypothetical protein
MCEIRERDADRLRDCLRRGVRRSDARPDDGLGEGVGKVDDSEAGNVTRSIADAT